MIFGPKGSKAMGAIRMHVPLWEKYLSSSDALVSLNMDLFNTIVVSTDL